MKHRHAICLVVDGLRASALGTYGNTTFPTPSLDALASRSVVFDWLLADSPSLEGFYRAAWNGVHAMRGRNSSDQRSPLAALQQAGVSQWLVTDEPWLIQHSADRSFTDCLLFENDTDDAATTLEDTVFGRYFAEVVEHLHQWHEDTADCGSLAWLHCRGLYGPWDAPASIREALLDEEDPATDHFVQPPTRLENVDDPDLLLSYRVAYAAQVQLLDACVGALLQAIDEAYAERETILMLTSSRGFALGEHGAIGTDCESMDCERMHLPWIIYPIGNATPLPRQTSLHQPVDIGATLVDWLIGEEAKVQGDGISAIPSLEATSFDQRRIAVGTHSADQHVVHTPAWTLRRGADGASSPQLQLFAKPDDRWEHNNVAALCPQVVASLCAELTFFQQQCQAGNPLPLEPADEELVRPKR